MFRAVFFTLFVLANLPAGAALFGCGSALLGGAQTTGASGTIQLQDITPDDDPVVEACW